MAEKSLVLNTILKEIFANEQLHSKIVLVFVEMVY